MSEKTIPILETATPLADPFSKPNILRVEPNNTWYYIKILFLLLMIVFAFLSAAVCPLKVLVGENSPSL